MSDPLFTICPSPARDEEPRVQSLLLRLSFFPTFALQCSVQDCLPRKACWRHAAAYKKNQSSLQWLERWIPPRSLFLTLNPKPHLFCFFLPGHLPLHQQASDFLRPRSYKHLVPWSPYVPSCFCRIVRSDSWFRKWGHHRWPPYEPGNPPARSTGPGGE